MQIITFHVRRMNALNYEVDLKVAEHKAEKTQRLCDPIETTVARLPALDHSECAHDVGSAR